jgi:uncharacterized protein YbaP (TraB family)
MRRLILVFLLGLSWLASTPGWAAERGALFKVSAHGHTMHLFGTMHVGVPAFYPLEPRLAAALSAARTLALEIDPSPSAAVAGASLRKHGMLAADGAGYEQLAPRQRALVDELARQAGLDPDTAKTFKPVLLATLLSLSQFEKLGYRPDLSADRALARMARASQVRVLELESLDEQLAMLDRLPSAQQWRYLEECLDTIDSGLQANEVRAVVDAWGSADQKALDDLSGRVAADSSVSGTFTREVLVEGRNPALAAKLARLLADEDNAVAAIGVLHLLGERGVPALLRERGISVERVY